MGRFSGFARSACGRKDPCAVQAAGRREFRAQRKPATAQMELYHPAQKAEAQAVKLFKLFCGVSLAIADLCQLTIVRKTRIRFNLNRNSAWEYDAPRGKCAPRTIRFAKQEIVEWTLSLSRTCG
jgi:hypothetical protein